MVVLGAQDNILELVQVVSHRFLDVLVLVLGVWLGGDHVADCFIKDQLQSLVVEFLRLFRDAPDDLLYVRFVLVCLLDRELVACAL